MPRCSQPKCEIAKTGRCLEGHDKDCPHLIPDDPATAVPNAGASRQTDSRPALTHRQFHSGEKLTVTEVSRLLNERPARIVLCVGGSDSGKTTFLAHVGEMFRVGKFSPYRFAGSMTLCAFERASWLATIASGVPRPDTRRTERIENDRFLHLRMYREHEPANHLEILVSDLAGETFPEAVASRGFCAGLCALASADHLVVFLDCARLVDSAKRHPTCDNARTFLQRVSTVTHQPKALQVQVVFSKWDYISLHPDKPAKEELCKEIETDFTKRFARSFAGLAFWRIAARPDGGIQPTDKEIMALFARWIEIPRPMLVPTPVRNPKPARDFSAFGLI